MLPEPSFSDRWSRETKLWERDCPLTISDLMFMPKSFPVYMRLRLKVSKTDPFRKGQTIVIGKANSNLCPISAMVAYSIIQSPLSQLRALVYFQSGSFVTRGRFTSGPGFYFQREGSIQTNLLVTVSVEAQLHSCLLIPLGH